MLTPQFNQDAESAGAVATAAEQNPATGAVAPELNAEQKPAENTAEEEEFFSGFNDDTPQTGEAPAGGAANAEPGKVVPETEYEKVKADLSKVTEELNELKAKLNNPLVVASLQYAEAQEAGVDLNPVDFIQQTFGVDAQRLSDEEVLKEAIKRDAAMVNVSLSEDELEAEFDTRWAELQNKGQLTSKLEIKKMRESLGKDSGGKLQKIIEDKKAEAKRAQEFIQAQVQNVEAELKAIKEAGKKDWGLKTQVDDTLEKQLRIVMENNFIRFDDKTGNIDVKHYLETALFALNPKAYVKKIQDATLAKADLKSLGQRSTGALTNPSTIPPGQEGLRKLTEEKFEPGTWDPKNAVPVSY